VAEGLVDSIGFIVLSIAVGAKPLEAHTPRHRALAWLHGTISPEHSGAISRVCPRFLAIGSAASYGKTSDSRPWTSIRCDCNLFIGAIGDYLLPRYEFLWLSHRLKK
jgi:hypothetical protein